MLIFNYTSRWVPENLKKERIKLSKAAQLNDPFELSPAFDKTSISRKAVRQHLLQPEIIRFKYQSEGGGRDYKTFKRWYRETLGDRIDWVLPGALEQTKGKFVNMFDAHFRMLCCSKRHDSILMWSHYAAKHEGVAVGFDSSREPFCSVGTFLVEVQYGPEKAAFKFDPRRPRSDLTKCIVAIAARKSPEWKYEEEVRMLFPLIPGFADEFLPIVPDAVAVVIFGCRCPPSHRQDVTAILSESRYQHVAIYEAIRSKDRFELEFLPIRKAAVTLPT